MSDIFLALTYTVELAHDGPSALERCQGHQNRLALLDYNMPGMNGLELCQRLRTLQPALVVVIVTGFLSATAFNAVAVAGGDCVLLKPVDFEALLPLVKRLVGGMHA